MINPASKKAHQRYFLLGEEVPGASTVAKIGQNCEGLKRWGYKLGRAGLNMDSVLAEAGMIGTIAHALFQHHLTKEEIDLSDCSPNQVKVAEGCAKHAIDFWEREQLTLVSCEVEVVSELGYGGTLDVVATNKIGKHVLLDWKSSKALYSVPHFTQIAGYEKAWNENNPLSRIRERAVVRVGKEGSDDFEARWLKDKELETCFDSFLKQLDLYRSFQNPIFKRL